MYNGHKNWNHWNVALWLFNDEGIYRQMVDAVRSQRRRYGLDGVAQCLLHNLPDETPDGAPYSFTSIRAALAHWGG